MSTESVTSYNRDQAFELLTQYVTEDSLVKHALAVEAAMRRFARHFNEDEDRWGVLGMLHDLDYEQFPEEHCLHTGDMLREAGYPEEDIRAILSHGWGLCEGVDIKPESNLELTLYTIDELTGLVTATVYMRPSRSILDLKLKSLKKKWKAKNFAAGCDRELISQGAEMLGMDLDEVMTLTIEGMTEAAEQLDLVGVTGEE